MVEMETVLARRALAPIGAGGVGMAVLGWFVAGVPAGLGALLASAIVVGTFGVTVLMHPLLRNTNPNYALAWAFSIYVTKVSILYVVVTAPGVVGVLDPWWFSGVLIGATLCWMGLHIVTVMRARIPVWLSEERR